MAVFLVKTFGLVLTAAVTLGVAATRSGLLSRRVYEGARQSGSTPKRKEPVKTYLRFAVLVLASLALAATTLAQIPVFSRSSRPTRPGTHANAATLDNDGGSS